MLKFYCDFKNATTFDASVKVFYNGKWRNAFGIQKASLETFIEYPNFIRMVGMFHMLYVDGEAVDPISGEAKKVKRIKFKNGEELCLD